MKSFHTLAMSDDEEAQIDKETGTLPWETVMCDWIQYKYRFRSESRKVFTGETGANLTEWQVIRRKW